MKKSEIKYHQKFAQFHSLLEIDSVKDQMLISYQKDFQQLKNFYASIDFNYIQWLNDAYKITFDPIYNTEEILRTLKNGLRNGEDTLKQNIRKNLIQLLFLQRPVPAIFVFLKISSTSFEIVYQEDFLLILDTMLQKLNLDSKSELYKKMHDNLIDTTDEELILQSIKLLNKKFELVSQLNQKQFEVFDKISNQFNKIDFSESKDIIIQIVKNFKEFQEKLKNKRNSLDQVKSEKFPQFILKVVLMLLKEQEIVVPELLLFLSFKENHEKRKSIAIKAQVKEIQKMFTIPRLKASLDHLKIDDTIFSKGAVGYDQLYSLCEKEYPIFLNLKLNGALISYIEYLYQATHINTQQFLSVFENQEFNDFLEQIWNICGKEIQQLLQNILIEDLEYAKYGSNILRIGTFLYRIKFKLEKRKLNIMEKGFDVDEQSLERRTYGVTERSMNPLFKTFVTDLVNRKKPFPLLLKTLKMDLYNLKVGYRITEMRELVVDPKFKKYMKEKHGVVWNREDPDENLDHIIARQYPIKVSNSGKKYELNWPRLIKKQAKLIYDSREQLKVQLLDVYGNANFNKVYNELIKLNDNNKKKMQTKEILMNLVAYIKSIKEEC